jgi:hypothetical protein
MAGRLGCAALALAFVTAWSGAVHATDDDAKTAARDLARAAKRDFDAGHLEEAELKFQQAYAIAKAPTLAVWVARVLVKRGQLLAGAEWYRQAMQLAPNDLWIGNVQQQAQADAQSESAALQPRIPSLRVTVQGATPREVDLTIDGVKPEGEWVGLALPADPGRHRIAGKRGTETSEVTIELLEGEHREALLTFVERSFPVVPAPGVSITTEIAARPALPASPPLPDGATKLTSNRLSPEPEGGPKPVYEKWWFWTAAGAAVVAGTVTAILLTRPPGGACSGASYPCVVWR